MAKKVEILLFEDNPGDVNLIEEMLEEFTDFPYEIINVETLNEGLNILKERPFNVILLDLRLPDSDGIDTFTGVYSINSRIPIIILTGMNDEKIGVDAVKKGAQDYLVKGQVDGRLLTRSIRYSIERKKAEDKIRNLANIVESSNDAIITESLDGIITSWNKGAEQIYGYSAMEIIGEHISILAPPHLNEEAKNLVEFVIQGGKIHHYETTRSRKDGITIHVSITLSPVFDATDKLTAISIIARDITKRKKVEEELQKSEEIRKKEIHHRIKNNLQVVSSLLDLQAEKFACYESCKTSEVLKAFKDSQNRVISMALIHEELYESRDVNTLNFAAYLKKLTKELFRCYSIEDSETHMVLEIEEKIFLEMDTVVPLGIIVNELVSNSLKHAFPERDRGMIRIKLCREENEKCREDVGNNNEMIKDISFILIISDDGIGIPEDLNLESPDTLGMQLVTTLVDQLEGELELNRGNGTEFTLKFTAV